MSRHHLLSMLLLVPVLAVAEDQLPEPGPENKGLRLRLLVENDISMVDEHTVSVEILNVSDKAITLVGSAGVKSFEDHLPGATTFNVYPAVLSHGFQIGVGDDPARPEVTIMPAKSFLAKWPIKGRLLSAHHKCWGLSFPTSGRFDIRAELTLDLKVEGEVRPVIDLDNETRSRIHIWSNSQPFVVGGSNKAPKGCVGTVIMGDAEKKTVFLDGLGTFNDTQPGDRFRIDLPMRGYWDLEIEKCYANRATAKVIKPENSNHKDMPAFPERGMSAGLLPDPQK
jgi:hypothetical protein